LRLAVGRLLLLQLEDVLLYLGHQALAKLRLHELLLLHEQWRNGILYLLLDHLRQGLLDSFGDCLLDQDLQILLRLDLLLQRVHLHVQISKLLGQLLEILNDEFLLGLSCLGNAHSDLLLFVGRRLQFGLDFGLFGLWLLDLLLLLYCCQLGWRFISDRLLWLI